MLFVRRTAIAINSLTRALEAGDDQTCKLVGQLRVTPESDDRVSVWADPYSFFEGVPERLDLLVRVTTSKICVIIVLIRLTLTESCRA